MSESETPAAQQADFEYEAPAWVRERNAAFAERLKGKLVLAPLTKGGNVPFRRLCTHFGAEVTLSEMAFSKPLLKGEGCDPASFAPWQGDHSTHFSQLRSKSIIAMAAVAG